VIEAGPAAEAEARHGSYTVHRELAGSYFGTRFLAGRDGTSTRLQLTVVEEDDQAARKRLLAAASACVELRSRLLPRDGRVEQVDSKLLYATQYSEGATMQELFAALAERSEAMPLEILLRIVGDVLDALAAIEIAAHAKGGRLPSIHGGVHPQTIHVGLDGQTRLLDVGLAAAAAAEPRWASVPSRILYCAPEVVRAPDVADVRSDIFSLGTLLWEMVACRPLFSGDDARRAREQVLHGPTPRVFRDRFVRGEPISAALTDVVERCLQRVPAARFGSFGELTTALGACGTFAARELVGGFVARTVGERGLPDASSAPRARDTRAHDKITLDEGTGTKRPSVDSMTPTVRPPEPDTASSGSRTFEITRETPLEATLAAASEAALAIAPALAPTQPKSSPPPVPSALARPPKPAASAIAPPAPLGKTSASARDASSAHDASSTSADAPQTAAAGGEAGAPKRGGIPPEALDTDPPEAPNAETPEASAAPAPHGKTQPEVHAEPEVEVDVPTEPVEPAQAERNESGSRAVAEPPPSQRVSADPPPNDDVPQPSVVPIRRTGRVVAIAIGASLVLLTIWLMVGRDGDTRAERDEATAPAAPAVSEANVEDKLRVKPVPEPAPEPASPKAAAAPVVDPVPAEPAAVEPSPPEPSATPEPPSAPKPRRRARPKEAPETEPFIPDGI
jgi:serine/threonine-protein kinase